MQTVMMSCLVFMVALTGCASKPTISEADNYLAIQAEVMKINSYRTRLLSYRTELTAVVEPLNVPNPIEPPGRVGELASYLADNDCLIQADFGYCYQVSRVRLIRVTRDLDHEEYINYMSLVTINMLIKNINLILNTLGDEPSLMEAIKNNLPVADDTLKKMLKK